MIEICYCSRAVNIEQKYLFYYTIDLATTLLMVSLGTSKRNVDEALMRRGA